MDPCPNRFLTRSDFKNYASINAGQVAAQLNSETRKFPSILHVPVAFRQKKRPPFIKRERGQPWSERDSDLERKSQSPEVLST